MKKIKIALILGLLLVGFVSQSSAQEKWYHINVGEPSAMWRCSFDPDLTPAATIERMRILGTPYEVEDQKIENGKPVQVRIVDQEIWRAFTFYLGIERCKVALKEKLESQRKETDRYK